VHPAALCWPLPLRRVSTTVVESTKMRANPLLLLTGGSLWHCAPPRNNVPIRVLP
jgi:hypothetical protein